MRGGRLWRQPGEGGGCGDSQVRGGRLWGQPGGGRAVVGTAR